MSDEDGLGRELAAIRPAQKDIYANSLHAAVRGNLVGATEEPFRLGRFTVIAPIGGGGMGVVFVAYDPDLDRKIALKVLRNRGEQGRREVLREGRALARLKHPNVVTVHEVGELDDQVFVAMEYVEGENLREWLRRPRSTAAIVGRLVEAGRGLAAAHAVGLVHRDFKPENVVIAEDRARVIDFGLARPLAEVAEQSAVTSAAPTASTNGGTPAYMAPERLAGAVGSSASDQYAFCMTALEALDGVRPGTGRTDAAARRDVPGWLRRALERGLSPEPGRRWPSMDALISALERGRRRAWTVRIVAGLAVVVGLGVAAEGLRRRDVANRVAACEAAGAEVDATWNDDARQRLRAAFAATGLSYAASTSDRVVPRLDAQAAAWTSARTEVCLNADVRGRWSPDTAARATYCLEDRLLDLRALVDEFGRADETAVRKAVRAVAGLRPSQSCTDEALLLRGPAPPEDGQEASREARVELARARSLALAGNFKAALVAATHARELAEAAASWPPLWASARTLEGNQLAETGAYAEAETASREAYFAAARAGSWGTAAEAATRLIGTIGRHQSRFAEARVWAEHAAVALGLGSDWHELNEAWRLASLGHLAEIEAAYAEARALHERARELRERALGPDHPETAISSADLGNVAYQSGDYAEAQRLYERTLEIWETALGPDHPHVGACLGNLASVKLLTGDPAAAQALLERALAIAERAFGPDHPHVGDLINNLAAVYGTIGANDKARALFERALASAEKRLGPDHHEVASTLVNIATIDSRTGAEAAALANIERALPIQEKSLGPDHPTLANTLILLANIHVRNSKPAAARPLYERALAIQEKSLGPDHSATALTLVRIGQLHLAAGRAAEALPLVERAAAVLDAQPGVQNGEDVVHFDLARALVATGGDRDRARAEAIKARDGFRAAGEAKAVDLAEVEAWLAATPQ